jgi:hypothetical protein
MFYIRKSRHGNDSKLCPGGAEENSRGRAKRARGYSLAALAGVSLRPMPPSGRLPEATRSALTVSHT